MKFPQFNFFSIGSQVTEEKKLLESLRTLNSLSSLNAVISIYLFNLDLLGGCHAVDLSGPLGWSCWSQ